jgi:biopolymer transport protein ExbB
MWQFFESALQLLSKGGVVMIPLFIFSLIGLGFTIERVLYLRRNKVVPNDILKLMDEFLPEKRISDAATSCRVNQSNLARIFYAGLSMAQTGEKREEIQKAMEIAGKGESANLSRHLPIISTVAGASPLLGLLGTVIGMIKTFTVIQMQGLSNTENLAGGISEALITTAAGLSIAIPYFIAAKLLSARVDTLNLAMEDESEKLLQTLTAPTKASSN